MDKLAAGTGLGQRAKSRLRMLARTMRSFTLPSGTGPHALTSASEERLPQSFSNLAGWAPYA
jgi:hypothetical protein